MINSADKIQIHTGPASNQNSIRRPTLSKSPYDSVAESYESQFIEHMLQEMRKSVEEDEAEGEDSGMGYYKSLLDGERSNIMAKQGLGIKEMILKQIDPNFAPKSLDQRFQPHDKNSISINDSTEKIRRHYPSRSFIIKENSNE